METGRERGWWNVGLKPVASLTLEAGGSCRDGGGGMLYLIAGGNLPKIKTTCRGFLMLQKKMKGYKVGNTFDEITLLLQSSKHFLQEMFDRTGRITRLKKDAVSTLFDFPKHLMKPCQKRRVLKRPSPESSQLRKSTKGGTRNLINCGQHGEPKHPEDQRDQYTVNSLQIKVHLPEAATKVDSTRRSPTVTHTTVTHICKSTCPTLRSLASDTSF
ncbi:hypothetical protein Btru_073664 [Bulinus truncatus]|nr:hypothetical protein Btru_073664 [Bulinus truncatus]